jgi:hypothetical protein
MRIRICANARTMSSLSDSVRCACRALGLYVFPYGGFVSVRACDHAGETKD